MAIKRLRIFAGPNGSGKSTILKSILNNKNIDLGVYVNADDIEALLHKNKKLNFFKKQNLKDIEFIYIT